jgi:hypothetical protein
MELSKSFPPADAILQFFGEINYQKLAKEFVVFSATAIAIIVAFSKFTATKIMQWYTNGGKEQIQSITNRCLQSINYHTGLIDKLSEQTVKFNNRIEKFYYYLSDVTV